MISNLKVRLKPNGPLKLISPHQLLLYSVYILFARGGCHKGHIL